MNTPFFIIHVTDKMPKKTDLILKSICNEIGLKANCMTSKQLRFYAKHNAEYKCIADIFFKVKKNACVSIISPKTDKHSSKEWTLHHIYKSINHIKEKEEYIKEQQDLHFIGVIYNNTFLTMNTLTKLCDYNKEVKKEKPEILKDVNSITQYITMQLNKRVTDHINVYLYIQQQIQNVFYTKKNIYI